ncbi:MAG: carboxylating nicotinate-nucleotide diphosphorylase [Chitinispirillaceae bacterium]|nr:carboxylating nicotinate-nucleotide diphosphorylase [Chitinispirillaceae bacterium]
MTVSIAPDIIDQYLTRALDEDLGAAGDITSAALFSDTDRGRAVIKSKSAGVLSGAYLLAPLFSRISSDLTLDIRCNDGDALVPDTGICLIEGPVKAILAGERTALNLLQRLSGIATLTSRFAAAIAHTKARLLDTRKTTPTLRAFEKLAVVHGGGANHRFGLYDMMLIKDTHVKRCGGIGAALEKAYAFRSAAPQKVAIEIEVRTAAEFEEALSRRPDRIMLDNMDIETMQQCVEKNLASGAVVELEASGAITLDTAAAVAQTGVDYISCGALTHSAPALDIHLLIM